jgi:D-serine deaminase-like pyridoxal phosphate-dependent protein
VAEAARKRDVAMELDASEGDVVAPASNGAGSSMAGLVEAKRKKKMRMLVVDVVRPSSASLDCVLVASLAGDASRLSAKRLEANLEEASSKESESSSWVYCFPSARMVKVRSPSLLDWAMVSLLSVSSLPSLMVLVLVAAGEVPSFLGLLRESLTSL